MLLKLGVDISRLNRECRRSLPRVEAIFARRVRRESVITSTFEGKHSEGSLHYADDAYDIRRPSHPDMGFDLSVDSSIVEDLKEAFGSDFDIVLEPDHIHIEYDPKEKQ